MMDILGVDDIKVKERIVVMSVPKIVRMCIIVIGIVCCFISSVFAVDDAIVAVVNDEVITLNDLRDYVHSVYVGLLAEHASKDKIEKVMQSLKTKALDNLIKDKLILSEANRLGIKVRPELVDKRLEQVKAKYGSEQEFMDALIRNGATISDLRKKIIEQYKIQFVIDREVRSKIYISPKEVTDYYEKHKDEFRRKERVNLQSIFISFGNDKKAARAKAEEALRELKAGADFLDVVEKYSDAPSVGIVEKGQLLPEVEDIVFNLKENKISPIIEVKTGFFIFNLKGRIPARVASLREVKDNISSILYKQKFKKRLDEWIDRLKKNAYIDIKKFDSSKINL